MMAGSGVSLLLLLALLHLSAGLSCPPCNRAECPEVTCSLSVGEDICGCCPTCLKGLGEPCGGIWNHAGSCDQEFVCSNPPNFSDQRAGECKLKE
ncbi:insulin-like growth factor-binding protein 7 [Cherax quadricarinatus]|uniref:insulin-like growth factor-binding protein 7 n=1 Tax=Cherax quadricarinatus TaxID=27406 RepID=UPI002378148C|nr:insulin-like growth factor-binding protein 7 [Cherax quadricarinatus]